MEKIESAAESLHDLLVKKPDLKMYDDAHKDTVVPKDSRYFVFNYNYANKIGEPKNAIINIGVFPKSIKVVTDQSIIKDMNDTSKNHFVKGFLPKIKRIAIIELGGTYDYSDFTRGEMTPRHWVGLTKDEGLIRPEEITKKVSESKLTGTSRSSYQTVESARIIVRHSAPIQNEEFGARSRNIETIFIENQEGERFKCPEGTGLNGARAYARHVKNGGLLNDDFGTHIGQMIKEMNSLRIFVRNMRGKKFEDAESNSMVEAAIDHYGALHRDLHGLRGQRGYEQYKSLWQPDQILNDDIDIESLKERFTKHVFDERLMDALPLVHRAYKSKKDKIGEEFETWVNGITQEAIEQPEVKSPFANSIDQGGAADVASDIDAVGEDEQLASLLRKNNFNYKFLDGTYWFESKQEVERAKDILAQQNIDYKAVKMGVYNYGYGNNSQYGGSTWEREIPTHGGMHESLDLTTFKRLAGLSK